MIIKNMTLQLFFLNNKRNHCLKTFFVYLMVMVGDNISLSCRIHFGVWWLNIKSYPFQRPFWWHLSVTLCFLFVDADRARKHGLDEFVQANPVMFDHHDLFNMLQTLTLDYRLNDAYTCLVRHPLHSYVHEDIRALSWIELKNFQHLFLQFCWTVPCEALYTIKW